MENEFVVIIEREDMGVSDRVNDREDTDVSDYIPYKKWMAHRRISYDSVAYQEVQGKSLII